MVISFDNTNAEDKTVEEYSLIRQKSVAKETPRWRLRLARFCSWLCGRNPKGFSTIEESISKRLPQGLTIQKATAEEIAQALQSAIIASGHQPEAIIKFVF